MDDKTRRAALRATAKVALAMTVFGCVGEVRVDGDDTRADDEAQPGGEVLPAHEGTPSATLPAVELPDGSSASELACQAPGPVEEVALDAEQLACCSALLEPLIPSDADGWQAWSEVADAPEVQGCCRVAVAHFDDDPGGAEVPWETLGPCCDALDQPVGPACTPWGPPVPPAVLGELPLLAGAHPQPLGVA